jgi:protein-disulfide isomerase
MKSVALALAAAVLSFAASPQVDTGKAIGNPSAPILMEIFSDFSCPHCKILHEDILPMLMRDFVVPGRVYIVLREFPLSGPGHPYSREAANDATAAARIGKYPQVAEALFKKQMTWAMNGKVWETVASVLTLPEQKKVQALAQEPGVTGEVQRDWEAGTADAINSTPTVIITYKGKTYPFSGVPANYYNLLTQFLNSLH